MGNQSISIPSDPNEIRAFTQAMLKDLAALEELLAQGAFLDTTPRVGVEQEFFLVDASGRPSPVADRVLKRLPAGTFSCELARFNVEGNLPPLPIKGSFLRQMEHGLQAQFDAVSHAASQEGAQPLLTGILPTLTQRDLDMSAMTPKDRYRELNRALLRARGEVFNIAIRGTDELEASHDSMMLESANTSLQLHLQVAPADFAKAYNLSQLLTAPLLAAASNSPLLFGRRLWKETRIALFQATVDARSQAERRRGVRPRVTFGDSWVEDSVLELFRDNVTRYRALLTCEPEHYAKENFKTCAPDLRSLMLHNGTVWRWNRPCYGVIDGVPHLRIESRVLPAGPSVVDQVANAAFFYGMMLGLAKQYRRIEDRIDFSDAKRNFEASAKHGLDAHFVWLDSKRVDAQTLILKELIPAAQEGLRRIAVPDVDIDYYLGIIEERVAQHATGSDWTLASFEALKATHPGESKHRALVQSMLRHQHMGLPVSRWPAAEGARMTIKEQCIRDIMTTDVFTIRADDYIHLALNVMRWNRIHHLPVEDDGGHFLGLVNYRELVAIASKSADSKRLVSVRAALDPHPVVITPDTPIAEAYPMLKSASTECLLITDQEKLVGIVTASDFKNAAYRLGHEDFDSAHQVL